MKGANEEDWNLLANFERDDYTRSYDHKMRSVYNAESLPWTWRYILTRFNIKHVLCGRSLPCADRARKCLHELCWKIEWKHHSLENVCETLPFRAPYQRTAVSQSTSLSLSLWMATPSQECCVFSFARGPFQRLELDSPCQHFSDDSLGFATHALWLDVVA